MSARITGFVVGLVLLVACGGPPPTPAAAPPLAPQEEAATPAELEIVPTPLQPTPDLPRPETLTTEQMHQRLDPFAGLAAGCALPCYNGLIPGASGAYETLLFYSRLGIGLGDLIPGDDQSLRTGTGSASAWLTKTSDVTQAEALGLAPPLVDIYLQDGLTQYVYVGWQYYPPYLTLPRVLEMLGPPTRLDLALVFDQQPPLYVLQLVYGEQQTGFSFSGRTSGDDSARLVCLSGDGVSVTRFGVFAPDVTPMEGLSNSAYLLPLAETVGLPYEQFAALVSAGNCLAIPAETWGAWQAIAPPE
jgi:hypothetical protein